MQVAEVHCKMKMVTELGLLMGQFGIWVEAKSGQWMPDSHVPVLPWKTVGSKGKPGKIFPMSRVVSGHLVMEGALYTRE